MRSISGFFAGGRLGAGARLASIGPGGRSSLATISTPALQEVSVQVADLLLGDLDLLEAGRDLLEREIAALLALGHERAQLLDLEERRLVPRLDQQRTPSCFSSVNRCAP